MDCLALHCAAAPTESPSCTAEHEEMPQYATRSRRLLQKVWALCAPPPVRFTGGREVTGIELAEVSWVIWTPAVESVP